jgi:Domain of unknown function (DUF1990)
VTLGMPFLALVAPCRIVSVVDEVTRWGFAYGTLPGHPEQGEEVFVVSIAPDETVRFEIVAFSRPADLLVRLSGSLNNWSERSKMRNERLSTCGSAICRSQETERHLALIDGIEAPWDIGCTENCRLWSSFATG